MSLWLRFGESTSWHHFRELQFSLHSAAAHSLRLRGKRPFTRSPVPPAGGGATAGVGPCHLSQCFTAGLYWTLQLVPDIFIRPLPSLNPTLPYLCIRTSSTVVWLLSVHIVWYLQHSTKTKHHGSSLGFYFFNLFRCEGFEHHGIPCRSSWFVLFLPLPGGVLSAHSALTDDPSATGHHRTWRYCQQCIVSFSRTISIFLKKKKYYQQYILSLFNVVLMGYKQFYFFFPYLYVVVLVPNGCL